MSTRDNSQEIWLVVYDLCEDYELCKWVDYDKISWQGSNGKPTTPLYYVANQKTTDTILNEYKRFRRVNKLKRILK